MKNKKVILFTLVAFYSSLLFASCSYVDPDNPFLVGQDPSVVYKNGYFYLVQGESNISIRKSRTIDSLKYATPVEVWNRECCHLWAPELQFIKGKWYIYYTKDDGNNDNHRMYALESEGTDPMGPYVHRGKVFDPANDLWAIDGSVLEKEDGSLYFVWSGWEGKTNGQQNLYIAPMSNPYTISGSRVLISRPDHSWERKGMAINEGPQPMSKNGKYFVVYSASASWTDDYCLGLISNKDGNLLNPASWIKTKEPVFSKTSKAYGPGHHCMVETPDGQCWNIYHANTISGSGWKGRTIRFQKFTWDELSNPVFGSPYLQEEEPVKDDFLEELMPQ